MDHSVHLLDIHGASELGVIASLLMVRARSKKNLVQEVKRNRWLGSEIPG
jgi:Cys-tRNA synthase (O-phospho-L-seryl-tRNA:Cys-tRNA synthase)